METNKYKYPRTFHLPFSNVESDSKLADLTLLKQSHVIVSEKMDGENTTIGKNYTHARSIDSNNHPSRNWVKGFAANFQYNLDDNMRVCGENLYAKHSISYNQLNDYFYGFSVWESKKCLNWESTLKIFKENNITPINVLYEGIYNEKIIENIFNSLDHNKSEGLVVRNLNSFNYEDFHLNVVKAVRSNHVITDQHWKNNWSKNNLR